MLLDGIAVVILALLVLDPRFRADPTHQSFYVGPVNDFLNGKTILVDFGAVYGLAAIPLLGLVFRVLPVPFTPAGLSLVNGALMVVEAGLLYLIARVAIGGPLVALTSVLLVLIASFYGPVAQWASLLTLPNQGPFRFLLAVVVVAAAIFDRPGSATISLSRLTRFGALGLASIWSIDSFTYAATAHAILVLHDGISARPFPRTNLRALAWDAAWSIAAIVTAQALFIGYIVLSAGQLPNYALYFQYFQTDLLMESSYYAILVAPWAPWAIVAAVYAGSIVALACRALWSPERARLRASRAAAGMTGVGIAYLSYYVVRSDANNLTVVCGPAVFLACYWLRHLTTQVTIPSAVRRAAALTLGCGLLLLVVLGWKNVIAVGSETLAGELLRSVWQREVTPGLHAVLDLRPTLHGGWLPNVEAQAAFVNAYRAGQPRITLLAEGTRTTSVLAAATTSQKLPLSHLYQEMQAPITLRTAPDLPAALDVGDRVFVQLAELYPFQVWLLAGLCQRFSLVPIADGPDGLLAFELQPRMAGVGWSWCAPSAPLLPDLIQALSPPGESVYVMGDFWTGNWVQRYAPIGALPLRVPPPLLSDEQIRQRFIYDSGLLGGELMYVRLEGLPSVYVDALRTMCLDVGLQVVATSRDGFTALRAGGEPRLDGEPCAQFKPPVYRTESGATFAVLAGRRRPVLDPTTLGRLVGTENPANLVLMPEAELATLPPGEPIAADHPAWSFVAGPGGSLYLLENWQRREVPDEETYRAHGGLPDRANVLQITEAQLVRIPVGAPLEPTGARNGP